MGHDGGGKIPRSLSSANRAPRYHAAAASPCRVESEADNNEEEVLMSMFAKSDDFSLGSASQAAGAWRVPGRGLPSLILGFYWVCRVARTAAV